MALVTGINHVAHLTTDLDRLAAFYRDVFEVPLVHVEDTPFGRLGVIGLGPATGLNVFEVPDAPDAAGRPEMFRRGHVDHFGLAVADEDAFWQLRERLVAGGHSDGEVADFGPMIGISYTDPDGTHCDLDLVLDPSFAGIHEPRPYERAPSR
jgi:catechol 2,3-dioxygenase-like lactoylglutathione lyase family enzyme